MLASFKKHGMTKDEVETESVFQMYETLLCTLRIPG